jgi:hypothetical protein
VARGFTWILSSLARGPKLFTRGVRPDMKASPSLQELTEILLEMIPNLLAVDLQFWHPDRSNDEFRKEKLGAWSIEIRGDFATQRVPLQIGATPEECLKKAIRAEVARLVQIAEDARDLAASDRKKADEAVAWLEAKLGPP